MPIGDRTRAPYAEPGQPPGLDSPRRTNDRLPAAPQDGFTYFAVMIAIAIIGVALATTGVVWHTAERRDREQQLLYVGDQFRTAIARYYNVGAAVAAAHQYPQNLKDLLRDPRLPGMARYLRKIYYDPITGTQQWGLIKTPDGRIMGVYSLSDERPLKQADFEPVDRDFEGKQQYSEWLFIYSPKAAARSTANNALTPASAGAGAGAGAGARAGAGAGVTKPQFGR